jgi:hypothetical protein
VSIKGKRSVEQALRVELRRPLSGPGTPNQTTGSEQLG